MFVRFLSSFLLLMGVCGIAGTGLTILDNAAHAEGTDGLDPSSTEALQKTQDLLKSQTERQNLIAKDPKAELVNQQVEATAGSQKNTQAVYELSADILADVAKEAKGDPVVMSGIISKMQRDPASIEKKMSPAELTKLKNIGQDAPGANIELPTHPRTAELPQE